MWWVIIIGLIIMLCGMIGAYVSEYWDSFCYKGKRRGVYQFAMSSTSMTKHHWPEVDPDKTLGVLVPAQKGL